MSVTTLSHETMTPMLPLDFDAASTALLDEEDRKSDREVCQRYLRKWTDNYGSKKPVETVTFAEFAAAAGRLEAAPLTTTV